MLIDQEEINALLAAAKGNEPSAGASAPARPGAPKKPTAAPPRAPSATVALGGSAQPDIARILRLRIPVIARLAKRTMSIAEIRRISCGTLIKFEESVDAPLSLMCNNRVFGGGEAVKVVERFGLRITAIDTPADRVRAMGGGV
ncbi:MAG: FliM/FliN family flagellar motor switch protein [Phycisphaerales bacterium]|nr:FliM/FliN family flagellar motor switch protein [Phycisphaerales bacterium]